MSVPLVNLPDGHALVRGFAAEIALADLVAAIAWERRTVRLYGREILQPRLTAWMGDGSYTYSGARHKPAPMPEIVARLRDRVQAATPVAYNSVLANLYRDGHDSIAWHSDDEPELGPEPTIASLSFGASRVFRIRRRDDHRCQWRVTLEHGDLLVMEGRSQIDYQHAIHKVARAGERVNLTFRTVNT
jgi:alkylated DNA repair dioxygenase AlkB